MAKLTDFNTNTYHQFDSVTYDNFYSQFANYNLELVQHTVKPLLDKPELVVDLGCGSGLFSLSVVDALHPKKLLGLDPNDDMLRHAIDRQYQSDTEFLALPADAVKDQVKADNLPDLLISKSAYHHFSDALPIAEALKFVKPGGAFVIVERTERSAHSYPLFEEGQENWTSFFSDLYKQRLKDDHYPDVSSSYGKWVEVTTKDFVQCIRNKQLSFIWSFSDKLINNWLEHFEATNGETIKVYEEYQVSVYYRR